MLDQLLPQLFTAESMRRTTQVLADLAFDVTPRKLYLNIELPRLDDSEPAFQQIEKWLGKNSKAATVKRLDAGDGMLPATYYVDCDDSEHLLGLVDRLAAVLPEAHISFVEQRGIPGL